MGPIPYGGGWQGLVHIYICLLKRRNCLYSKHLCSKYQTSCLRSPISEVFPSGLDVGIWDPQFLKTPPKIANVPLCWLDVFPCCLCQPFATGNWDVGLPLFASAPIWLEKQGPVKIGWGTGQSKSSPEVSLRVKVKSLPLLGFPWEKKVELVVPCRFLFNCLKCTTPWRLGPRGKWGKNHLEDAKESAEKCHEALWCTHSHHACPKV